MDTEASQWPDELRVAYEAGVEHGRRLAAVEIEALRAENAELRRRLVELEALVESLRVRAEMNSSNSSLPPSSDRPGDRERLKQVRKAGGESGGDDKPKGAGDNPSQQPKPAKKRKRGAQKGHKGAYRNDLTKPDEVVEVWPKECPRCKALLSARHRRLRGRDGRRGARR